MRLWIVLPLTWKMLGLRNIALYVWKRDFISEGFWLKILVVVAAAEE